MNIETITFKKYVNLIKEMLCEAGNEKLNFLSLRSEIIRYYFSFQENVGKISRPKFDIYVFFLLLVSDDHLSFTLCSEPGWQRRSHGLLERVSDLSHERSCSRNVSRARRFTVTISSLWRRQ